jgi:hypothetical protein
MGHRRLASNSAGSLPRRSTTHPRLICRYPQRRIECPRILVRELAHSPERRKRRLIRSRGGLLAPQGGRRDLRSPPLSRPTHESARPACRTAIACPVACRLRSTPPGRMAGQESRPAGERSGLRRPLHGYTRRLTVAGLMTCLPSCYPPLIPRPHRGCRHARLALGGWNLNMFFNICHQPPTESDKPLLIHLFRQIVLVGQIGQRGEPAQRLPDV